MQRDLECCYVNENHEIKKCTIKVTFEVIESEEPEKLYELNLNLSEYEPYFDELIGKCLYDLLPDEPFEQEDEENPGFIYYPIFSPSEQVVHDSQQIYLPPEILYSELKKGETTLDSMNIKIILKNPEVFTEIDIDELVKLIEREIEETNNSGELNDLILNFYDNTSDEYKNKLKSIINIYDSDDNDDVNSVKNFNYSSLFSKK